MVYLFFVLLFRRAKCSTYRADGGFLCSEHLFDVSPGIHLLQTECKFQNMHNMEVATSLLLHENQILLLLLHIIVQAHVRIANSDS